MPLKPVMAMKLDELLAHYAMAYGNDLLHHKLQEFFPSDVQLEEPKQCRTQANFYENAASKDYTLPVSSPRRSRQSANFSRSAREKRRAQKSQQTCVSSEQKRPRSPDVTTLSPSAVSREPQKPTTAAAANSASVSTPSTSATITTSPSQRQPVASSTLTAKATTPEKPQQQQQQQTLKNGVNKKNTSPLVANGTVPKPLEDDFLPATVTVRQKPNLASNRKKYLPDASDVLSPLSPPFSSSSSTSAFELPVPVEDADAAQSENHLLLLEPSVSKLPTSAELRPLEQHESVSPAAVTEPKKTVSVDSHGKPKETVPPFYFKYGRPVPASDVLSVIANVKEVFAKLEDGRAKESDMPAIMKAAGLPLYWKKPLFVKCNGIKNDGFITFEDFSNTLKSMTKTRHDEASRFVALLASCLSQDYLVPEDFESLVQDVVDTHPGLSFLREAKEFHLRYVHTVIARILYASSVPWRERLEIKELRNSKLLKTIRLLEEEDDINQITDYFSYEHFYVIYCKFWELDKDHDLVIDMQDLSRHADYALSSRIIKRIFSGLVNCDHLARFCLRNKDQRKGKMTYPEFAWFLMAEEDKRQPTSVEYWFRCLDRDGDGILSFDEMKYFYDEQVSKMSALGMETLPFTDILCQILDMVKPEEENRIHLKDLKRCKMSPFVFDVLFNVDKYLEHEQRDPNATFKAEVCEEISDWDRYAASEYEMLVQEESVPPETEINFEDDECEVKTVLTKAVDDMNLSSPTITDSELRSLSQCVTSTMSGSKEIS